MRRLFVLVLAVAACSRSEAPGPFRLRIGAVGQLAPLAPGLVAGYSNLVNPLVFQPLVSPERERPWHSKVLADLEPSGPARFRFRLGAGVSFSDGAPLRLEDVVAVLGGSPSVSAGAEWVEVAWKDAARTAANHLLDADVFRAGPSGPIGTGPFAVVSSDARRILLRRRVAAPNRIFEVEMVSYPTPREAFAAALRREVNFLVLTSEAQLDLLDGVTGLRTLRRAGLHSIAALFNAQRLDRAARQDLARGLPTGEISRAYGRLCRARGTDLPNRKPVERRPLEVLALDSLQGFSTASLALRRALGPEGHQVVPTPVADAYARGPSHDFDLMFIPVQTWPLETALSRWVTGDAENWGSYSNPAFDQAFRASDFARAQAELDADPPALFICDLERSAAVDARLTNARLGDYDLLDSLDEWEVAP